MSRPQVPALATDAANPAVARPAGRSSRAAPSPAEAPWDAFEVHRRSPDPFLAYRPVRADGRIVDFRCVYANAAVATIPGFPGLRRIGHGLLAAAPNAMRRGLLAAFATVTETGEPWEQVVRYVHAGAEHWFRLIATRPGPDQLAIVATDITDRMRTEARRVESEERFRLLVESISQAVWETDEHGMVTTDSPSWRAFTGQTLEEWLGDGWAAAVHPDDRGAAVAAWKSAVAHRHPIDGEFRIRRNDGVWRWTNVRAAPLVEPGGRVRKWVGMNIDIAAAHGAREALEISEERVRLATQVAGFATFDHDLVTGRSYWSPTLASLVGGAPDAERIGLAPFVHPDDTTAVAEAELQLRSLDRPYRYEHRVVCPDGRIRWLAVHGQTFFEGSGDSRRAVRSVGIVQDLTDRVRAAELRDVFVGMLSHELRTPVTAIYGDAEMLRRGTLPEAVRTELLGDMVVEAERMRRLVENLLVLAKEERGAELGLPVPVSLGPLAARAVEVEHRRSAVSEIELDVEPGLPPVLADEAAAELALSNLLSNALKYGPPDGRVTVRLRREGGDVVVRVLDEGAGIPDGGEARLFELFYRADQARRSAAGAGIGLYVVRACIEAAGGRVWGRNREEGGAEFGFALPVLAQVLAPVPMGTGPAEPVEAG